jgi:hypothetical protein
MGYDVDGSEACIIFSNLVALAKNTLVWPHPEDLFLGGSKMQCYETLRVASLSMEMSTPLYVTVGKKIHDPTFLKNFAGGKVKGVLKRDYSMKSQHVILPTTPNLSSKIKKALKEEEKTWKGVEGFFGRPKWLLQPIVAHLLHVGEVRCFIVSGRLLYKITTTPGGGRLETQCEITNDEPIRPLHTHA